MKQLHLTQDQIAEDKYQYRVTKVVNDTSPKIGERLTQAHAESFCKNAEWNVTITSV